MVELRGCTHMNSHMSYIRAIKDGTVKIVMNVVAKGKSKLKLRDLVDIYKQEKSKDGDSIARIQERVLSDVDNVSDMAQQGSCLFGAEVNVETDLEDFNMTLDKIRKQCKDKKRKRRNCRDIESVSPVKVKQECCSPRQTEDEGCDLEEPLSSWNTKFSKRRKRKQESKAKRDSTSSTSSLSVEKVILPLFCHVKSEPWEDSYSFSEDMDFIPTDPLLDCSKESESPTNTELVDETMHDSSKDTRLALYWSAEPNYLGMVAIEDPITSEAVKALKDAPEEFDDESEEFKDAPEEFNDAPEEFNNNIALQNEESCLYGDVSSEETELEVPQNSESESIGCLKNSISSYTSPDSLEVQEDEVSNDPKPYLDMTITGLEIVKVEAPEILTTDYSRLPTVDFGVENTEIVWETEDIAKDDLPGATDIIQLPNCCDSVPDDNTISVEEEEDRLQERLQEPPASSGQVGEAGDHIASQLYKAPDEVTTDVEIDSIQQQKLHYQPEKLLSGRKALSPNSQAKLRKAMENPDSPEKKSKKPKVKLYFSRQSSHRILKAEGLETIDRVEVNPNSKQAIPKTKNNNTRQQMQYQRATSKFPRRDNTQATKPQPFSTGCTSLQGCSQKAITFSQGQMRDFQFVASRLTKELKSMRQITKRCLLAESNTSNIPDCNLDEVKALIGNAEKTEESSKKWLSMIERDCNRFCKLMGMVKEDSSAATENIVQIQKKKKIKFADDAGGDLCHVKVFEIDLESES